jgi:hypothetical protein
LWNRCACTRFAVLIKAIWSGHWWWASRRHQLKKNHNGMIGHSNSRTNTVPVYSVTVFCFSFSLSLLSLIIATHRSSSTMRVSSYAMMIRNADSFFWLCSIVAYAI